MRSSHTRPHCATHKQLIRHNRLGQGCVGCETWELHRLLLPLLNASCSVVLLQVVTFDAGGVSGHANHVSLHAAVRYSVCTLLWVPPWGGAGSAWCWGGSRTQGSVDFTAPTECQAVGHDTVWRNCHSSGNDLQHLLVFHQLGPCQSHFHWALFALPVPDPAKICHRSLCTSALRRVCE